MARKKEYNDIEKLLDVQAFIEFWKICSLFSSLTRISHTFSRQIAALMSEIGRQCGEGSINQYDLTTLAAKIRCQSVRIAQESVRNAG